MFKKSSNTFETDFVAEEPKENVIPQGYSPSNKYNPNISTRPMKSLSTHSEKPKWSPPEKFESFKKPILEDDPETTIGEEVLFKGELSFNRFICIRGYFEGNLISEGKLSIGPKGVVKADIKLKEVIIEGLVEGNVSADRVELIGKAQVRGNIVAKSLCVDEGTTIIGQVKVAPHETSEEEKNESSK